MTGASRTGPLLQGKHMNQLSGTLLRASGRSSDEGFVWPDGCSQACPHISVHMLEARADKTRERSQQSHCVVRRFAEFCFSKSSSRVLSD
jgi:hypothetical protein